MILSLLLALAQADIAIFVMDDVAAADLALYGGPVACPNLEALAAQGVSFTRCYANSSCAPTRRSILTGHWWVTGNGSSCPGDSITGDTPLLAEEFLPECLPNHESGVTGKWHMGVNPYPGYPMERAPIAQGFDYWLAGSPENVSGCAGGHYTSWLRVDADLFGYVSSISTAYEPTAVRVAFNAGWNTVSCRKLAIVSPNLAHVPFHVPPSGLLPPGHFVGGSQRARYEAMILAWDTLLGQMLANVNLTTTLVFVVGDNGTPPPVAPNSAKAKGTSFERGARVPLVIAGSGVAQPGRTDDSLVHVVDLWATAIEAGEGSAPGGSPYPIVSVSLMPILQGQAQAPHEFVLIGSRWGALDGDLASVRSNRTKLRWLDPDGDGVPDTEEFYDLAVNPAETVNQIANPLYASEVASHRAFMLAAIP